MTAAPTKAPAGNASPGARPLRHVPPNLRTSTTPRDAPRADTPPQTTVFSHPGTNVMILK
jgi:hypothetical protein